MKAQHGMFINGWHSRDKGFWFAWSLTLLGYTVFNIYFFWDKGPYMWGTVMFGLGYYWTKEPNAGDPGPGYLEGEGEV
jgi:hypothetical protein